MKFDIRSIRDIRFLAAVLSGVAALNAHPATASPSEWPAILICKRESGEGARELVFTFEYRLLAGREWLQVGEHASQAWVNVTQSRPDAIVWGGPHAVPHLAGTYELKRATGSLEIIWASGKAARYACTRKPAVL